MRDYSYWYLRACKSCVTRQVQRETTPRPRLATWRLPTTKSLCACKITNFYQTTSLPYSKYSRLPLRATDKGKRPTIAAHNLSRMVRTGRRVRQIERIKSSPPPLQTGYQPNTSQSLAITKRNASFWTTATLSFADGTSCLGSQSSGSQDCYCAPKGGGRGSTT